MLYSDKSDSSTASLSTAPDGTADASRKAPTATPPPIKNAWEEELNGGADTRKLWHGWDGICITTFGIAIPLFIAILSAASAPKRFTLVVLNHPVETIAEVLLVLTVPLINYIIWSSLCKNRYSFSPRRGLALGAGIGTSLTIAAICFAGVLAASRSLQSEIGTGFTTGFCFMAVLSSLAACCGIYISRCIVHKLEFARSRKRVITYVAAGSVISLLTFVAAEARPWCIRIAERMTISNSAAERNRGMDLLRALYPERELRMECSDTRAAGLCGLFIPLKSSTQHQLYFALTGKPFSFHDSTNTDLSSLPDDYLSLHVVGEKVEGLALVRSSLNGAVHPETLSATVNWTLVLKNDSDGAKEARAEIAVPPGAAINGLTLWINGEPQNATFAASGKVEGISNWVQGDSYTPAMLTDLGRGRLLLHCYPIEQEEEMKVKFSMVVPLKPESERAATFTLPRFIAANFDLSGDHEMRLRSDLQLGTSLPGIKQTTNPDGEKLLIGGLKKDLLNSTDLMVTATLPEIKHPVAVLDNCAMYLHHQKQLEKARERQQAANAAIAEQQVMVMVDGSKNVERQVDDVTRALAEKAKARSAHVEVIPIKPDYVVEQINRFAATPPKHLVVVLDASISLKEHAPEVVAGLSRIPSNIPVSLVVASQEKQELSEPAPLNEGLKKLKNVRFIGGQDNLQAVIKGAELAGESQGGALLWIHGPQPSLNREIYIMAPFESAPRFYEMALDSGDTDTVEFFKNHSEIGPFSEVPRNSGITADLDRFFARWQPGTSDYSVQLTEVSSKPSDSTLISSAAAGEIIALHANAECLKLLSARQTNKAAQLAIAYGLVTPVSSAVVLQSAQKSHDEPASHNITDFAASFLHSSGMDAAEPAPLLQGATNGTIGPQAGDATVVQGVNTAGTVRVNNLANLEALFNILANLAEIVGLAFGGVMVLQGIAVRTTISNWMGTKLEMTPAMRIAVGVTLVVIGLSFPGMINWFVSSARDANLFS